MKLGTLLFLGLFWAIFFQAQNLQWKEFNTPMKASLRGLSPVQPKYVGQVEAVVPGSKLQMEV